LYIGITFAWQKTDTLYDLMSFWMRQLDGVSSLCQEGQKETGKYQSTESVEHDL
jgi:hypothetical protein